MWALLRCCKLSLTMCLSPSGKHPGIFQQAGASGLSTGLENVWMWEGRFPGIGLQSPFKIESLSVFDKRPNINDNTLVNRLWWSWRWAFLGNPYWNTTHLSESDRPWARSSQGILWNANGQIGVCVFSPSCRSLHRSEEYRCFMAFLQVVCLLLDMQLGPSLEGACLLLTFVMRSPSSGAEVRFRQSQLISCFFPSSVLPPGDWKSHFSSSVATVTIFCDFSYCYPVPCPRDAPMPLALWRLLSGSYFLYLKCSQLRALLKVCRIGSACFLFFQLSLIFHFPFLSRMPLVGSQLDARSSRCHMVPGCISLTSWWWQTVFSLEGGILVSSAGSLKAFAW